MAQRDMPHETWSIQETRVAARKKGSWSSSPLNVTQAAGHKERRREYELCNDVAGCHWKAWKCVMIKKAFSSKKKQKKKVLDFS